MIGASPGKTIHMEHIFLFQEREWTGRGEYLDGTGKSIPFEGMVKTIHEEDLWLHGGRMTLSPDDGPPLTFENWYEIEPFRKGKGDTVWTSRNPSIGFLTGRFVIVNEAILSFCRSKDGLFTGHEVFIRIDGGTYENRGTLFRGDERLSSWSLRLQNP